MRFAWGGLKGKIALGDAHPYLALFYLSFSYACDGMRAYDIVFLLLRAADTYGFVATSNLIFIVISKQ